MEVPEGWEPMDTFPQDGSKCKILFREGLVNKDWFWGRELVGKGYCIRGSQNKMSSYLVPHAVGWQKQEGPGNTD